MGTAFLYSIAGGVLAVLTIGKLEQIAWRFLRLVGFLLLALVSTATAWSWSGSGPNFQDMAGMSVVLGLATGLCVVAMIFIAPGIHHRMAQFRVLCGVGAVLGLAAACISTVVGVVGADATPLALVMILLNQVLGSLLLGAITAAWLLGHAYLTATKMTIAPLRHFSTMLSLAVALRCLFSVASVGVGWLIQQPNSPSILDALANQWLIVALRAGVGLVAVAVFAYMVSDCVRLRATQSATGILYFGSIFAYIGELASQHLVSECGWPL